MSNIAKQMEAKSTCQNHPCHAIDMIIEPEAKDLGGFNVYRALPHAKRKMVGPWIFFDHLPPYTFPKGQGIDVRPHPHIGLATVTYLFKGELLHRDNLGNVASIKPGDINWMTAGRGIVHSERTPIETRENDHEVHALQLWVALPKQQELCEPSFNHYDADDLPVVNLPGAEIRVMIGEAYNKISPVKTSSPTLYCEVRLQAGASIELPQATERAIFMIEGELNIENTIVSANTMAILHPKEKVAVLAEKASRFVIIGGDPVGERIVWWNYVASSTERLQQAKQDWRLQKFAKIPGETEFIPLPEE